MKLWNVENCFLTFDNRQKSFKSRFISLVMMKLIFGMFLIQQRSIK